VLKNQQAEAKQTKKHIEPGTCFVEPENGSALLGAAAAAEELHLHHQPPVGAQYCTALQHCCWLLGRTTGRASSGCPMTIYAGARPGTAAVGHS
jgi:hypothetical protein